MLKSKLPCLSLYALSLLLMSAMTVVAQSTPGTPPATNGTKPVEPRAQTKPAQQQSHTPPAEEDSDLVIIANVTARELRFEVVPSPNVTFTGKPARHTSWEAQRDNLPDRVQPGVTYRNIGIRLKIVSRFADIERIVSEALGETPITDDVPPPQGSPQPPSTQTAPPSPVANPQAGEGRP